MMGGVARDVVGGVLWRGFLVMGFTHPQLNYANSIRKNKIPFHAIWGLCWYNLREVC